MQNTLLKSATDDVVGRNVIWRKQADKCAVGNARMILEKQKPQFSAAFVWENM